jgi:hypothetical protein
MPGILDAALANLLSPMILAFALGLGAAFARSDLSIPEQIGKAMAIYLMFAIGFKGGAAVAESTFDLTLLLTIVAGLVLSFALPFVAFALLGVFTHFDRVNKGAVAAHYGSISVVTFVTASEFLGIADVGYEGYLVAVMALMETPAIISGLWLARGAGANGNGNGNGSSVTALFKGETAREIFLNGSVVLLVGAFFIGMVSGKPGYEAVAPFFEEPFKGVLCLFLLDMGILAASRLRGAKVLTPGVVLFGVTMPIIGAAAGLLFGWAVGLSLGGATLLAVLCASASYIAVPAAMRLALPDANPAVYVTLSLAVTFPFNILIGIPLYLAAGRFLYGV